MEKKNWKEQLLLGLSLAWFILTSLSCLIILVSYRLMLEKIVGLRTVPVPLGVLIAWILFNLPVFYFWWKTGFLVKMLPIIAREGGVDAITSHPEVLHKEESLLKTLKPSWKHYIWYFILGAFLIPIYGLGFLLILYAVLLRKATTYYITTKRLIYEYKLWMRRISSVTYDKIQDLHLSQSWIQMTLGIGTIHVNTAGTILVELTFEGIPNPISIMKLIEERISTRHR